jgi:hypothetical protein
MGHALLAKHPETANEGAARAQRAYDDFRDAGFAPKSAPRIGEPTEGDTDAAHAYYDAFDAEWAIEVCAELAGADDLRAELIGALNNFRRELVDWFNAHADERGAKWVDLDPNDDRVRMLARSFMLGMTAHAEGGRRGN